MSENHCQIYLEFCENCSIIFNRHKPILPVRGNEHMIKVDLSGCASFFDASGPDFSAAAKAHRTLLEKTGEGAEFTGWMCLPQQIKLSELKSILAAANKIRGRSKALVVIGIGGSYLGARGGHRAPPPHPAQRQPPRLLRGQRPERRLPQRHHRADWRRRL